MKKSLGLLSVAVISTLTLTGCPSGNGSNSNTAVGVGNGQINSTADGSCNVQASYYTCTQTLNGLTLNTASVSFTTNQDFCAKINDNYSNTNKDLARGQIVAPRRRQQLYTERCQNTGGLPTIPGQTNMALKTFTCQLQVKKGDAVYAGEAQQFSLPATGGRVNLFANAMKSKTTGGIFRFTRTYMVNLANVVMQYSPALSSNPSSMDQIKMSVANIDGDISASVSGFAGADNTLSITPQDADSDQTEVIATCSSSDAKAMGLVKSTGAYQCIGTERADGRTTAINYVNQVSDVVASGISITNSVFVQGTEGQTAAGGGVTFSQATKRYDDSTVALSSNLSSATSISIEKLSYSLKVKCQPK